MSLRKKISSLITCALLAGSMLASPLASAWDGALQGKIAVMEVTAGSNFGLRVILVGGESMCGAGSPTWAYLNDSDSNYKTYAAALMMAKALGSTVIFYTTLEGGYCHIGHIAVL